MKKIFLLNIAMLALMAGCSGHGNATSAGSSGGNSDGDNFSFSGFVNCSWSSFSTCTVEPITFEISGDTAWASGKISAWRTETDQIQKFSAGLAVHNGPIHRVNNAVSFDSFKRPTRDVDLKEIKFKVDLSYDNFVKRLGCDNKYSVIITASTVEDTLLFSEFISLEIPEDYCKKN